MSAENRQISPIAEPIHDALAFGDALRSARRQQGLTQRQAAELSGVSTRLWNEAEFGKRPGLALDTALRMIQTVALDLHLVLRSARDLIDGGSRP
jgi:transcriptional regulator with XRE-family HTH domain